MASQGFVSRKFILCTLSCFFLTLVFFVFFTGMPAYATGVLGTDEAMAGMIAAVFIAGDVAARLLLGNRMRSVGAKRMAFVSLALCSAFSCLYFVAGDIPSVCVVCLVHGAAYGVAETAIYTMVADCLPADRRGTGMGYFMLNYSLASAVGPFLSINLITDGSYDLIFLAGVLAAVVATVLVVFIRDDIPRCPHVRTDFKVSDYIERSALRMAVILFLFFMTYSGVLTFIAPYGAERDLVWYASMFFIVMSISTVICRLFLGRLYDRRGVNAAITPFLLAYIVGMFILGLTSSGPLMMVSAFLIGTMIAMLNMVAQAVVVKDLDPSRYGVALATLNTFLDLSYMAGPILNGLFIGYYGYAGNYTAMAIIACASFVLYLALIIVPHMRRARRVGPA